MNHYSELRETSEMEKKTEIRISRLEICCCMFELLGTHVNGCVRRLTYGATVAQVRTDNNE
jgi:hypothetical protein